MRKVKFATRCALFATFLLLPTSQALSAEKLSDILRESKWNGIIGTWVDADTKGAAVKTTYAWKIKDRAIEITTKEATKESVALMGVNGSHL